MITVSHEYGYDEIFIIDIKGVHQDIQIILNDHNIMIRQIQEDDNVDLITLDSEMYADMFNALKLQAGSYTKENGRLKKLDWN